jgi:hypothetical protein
MKKTHLILLALVFMSLVGFSQNAAGKPSTKATQTEDIYSPLKPADASPAVFSSKEEMQSKLQDKKYNTIELIRQNKDNPEQVKQLREQLWRFEHAIVIEGNK